MSKLKYSIITEIKKSNKSNIYLASVEWHTFPVIVKEIKYGNIKVFEALKNISSAHLPQILYVEEMDDCLLVVEEYLEGELLSEYIREQKLTEENCLYIAEQMCDALKVLHSHVPPLIHRDIKPSNIIIGKTGDIKLIDFDSSRLYNDEAENDTRFLGTEKYAPPEQYGFSQTDCRSDIYSFGVVLEKFTQFISTRRMKKWKFMVEKSTLFSPDSRFQDTDEICIELKKIRKNVAPVAMKSAIIIAALLVCTFVCFFIINRSFTNTNDVGTQDNESTTSTIAMLEDISTQETNQTTKPQEHDVIDNNTTDNNITDNNATENTTTTKEEETTLDDGLEYQYSSISPEWRDLPSDIPEYVSLKEEIREHRSVVIYHFKDRKYSSDYLHQEKDLDYSTVELLGISLCAIDSGAIYNIDTQYIELKDNVIALSREYMDKLENGYYLVTAQFKKSNGETYNSSVHLYVASSDVYEEANWCLQHTTFSYRGGENEKIHLVVKNHCINTLDSLKTFDGMEIDKSMYKVLQEGRVLEISSELLSMYKDYISIEFTVVFQDGRCETITVYNE